MWGSRRGADERAVASFANRFEANGDGYVFRKDLGSPGFQMTAAERDAFVARFERDYRRTMRLVGGIGLTAIVAATVAMVFLELPDGMVTPVTIALAVAFFAAIYLLTRRLWNAPVRELASRLPSKAAYSKDEASRRVLERLDSKQAAILTVGLLSFIWFSTDGRPFEGWGWLWVGSGAVLIVALGVQLYRKWRITGRL